MRWRLALLVLFPSLGLIVLATMVIRDADADYTEQRHTRSIVQLAVLIGAVDKALGEEGIVASSIRGESATWERFVRDEASVSDRQVRKLGNDPHLAISDSAIAKAFATVTNTIALRRDLLEGDRTSVEITDRYDAARRELREAFLPELAKHVGDGSAGYAAGLIALIEARSAHLDERVVVAMAIENGAWSPGHYSRAISAAAVQRDRVRYAHGVAVSGTRPREIRDELSRLREQLSLSDGLGEISSQAWRRSSDAWLIVLNSEIEREELAIGEQLNQLERDAARNRNGTLAFVSLSLLALGAATIGAIVRLTRDVERRLEMQAREAKALEAIAQGQDLDTILESLAVLAGTDGNGRPTHQFTREPSTDDAVSLTPEGYTDLWLQEQSGAASDTPSTPEGVAAVGLAVMAQQRADDEAHLHRRATIDELTGLFNRFSILRLARDAVRDASVSDQTSAIFSIDLDGFAAINDRHGDDVGDDILRRTATRLSDWVDEFGGAAGRTGSDEFLVVAPGLHESELLHTASLLINHLSAPVASAGVQHPISASIGCANTRESADAEAILRELDDALSAARQRGPAHAVMSDDELRRSIREAQAVRDAVKLGLERYEFEPWFQPLWEDNGKTLVGFEALVRWRQPDGSVHGPGGFLWAVEELNLLPKLDGQIFHAVAHQLNRWREAGLHPQHVGVNVSTQRLEHPGFVRETLRAIEETGCQPSSLVVEVTESGLMSDIESNSHKLQQLREVGMLIAADDFGQGYSSLGYLSDLPIDVVKLDRVFIDGIDSSPTNQSIVEAVAQLATSLDLKLVAEGIERAEELDWITTQGVAVAQGFLLGRPMPAAEATALLDQHRPNAKRGELAEWMAQVPADMSDDHLADDLAGH